MNDSPKDSELRTQADNFAQSSKIHSVLMGACCIIFLLTGLSSDARSQGPDRFKDFSATNVFRELNSGVNTTGNAPLVESWWDRHVQNSLREVQPLPADLHTLLFLAVHNSNQIKIAKTDPLIRETAIQEADSNFDWVRYLDAAWNDTSEPVSTSLIAGADQTRLNDTTFLGTAGVRRNTRSGGRLDISQRFGWQNNNSTFFIPNNQATGQFTVSYTHPLLRGRGTAFNNSIVFLAQVDSEVANNEFLAILQDELLEITRAYWAMYLERAVLAHQMRLYLKTKEIFQALRARQAVDAQGTQLILSASALENRRSDLIRAQTAVTNAETRLRGMINAPELGNTDQTELIPIEPLAGFRFQADLQNEIQVALQNRPEIRAAVQQVKAGSIRLGVVQHELLPVLNLVTQGFASGLQGSSDFAEAFSDQFTLGRPSYSVGVQYELPVGNRLAKARVSRRQHELSRLQSEYSRALEAVQTEVDIAVRELNTAFREIQAKSRALVAAEAEVTTIEQRWQTMIDGNGTSSLNLESLLRAQERVTAAEREYVSTRLTYSLAVINLKRANGTLLQSENVSVTAGCTGDGCRDLIVEKGAPAAAIQPVEIVPQFINNSNQFSQVPAQQFPTQQFPTQQFPVQQFPVQQLPTQQVPVQHVPVQQTRQTPVASAARGWESSPLIYPAPAAGGWDASPQQVPTPASRPAPSSPYPLTRVADASVAVPQYPSTSQSWDSNVAPESSGSYGSEFVPRN